MSPEDMFAVWAPSESVWSRWAKPVLFAHSDAIPTINPPPSPVELPRLDWVPDVTEHVALVLDLPGAVGVELGVELAKRGYRPVPLYNALPGPVGDHALVEVWPIVRALEHGAASLAKSAPPPDAPPAFLLDAHRAGRSPTPELERWFDNRSVSFPTDFPSALFLRERGVSNAMLVWDDGPLPEEDLAHTLLRWQQAGLTLREKRLRAEGSPAPLSVARPSWFRMAMYRMLALFGLRSGPPDGFGGFHHARSAVG